MTKVRVRKAVQEFVKEASSKGPITRSAGEILREVGYSEAAAANPGRVINGKEFQYLLNKHLNDDEMIQKVREIYLGGDTRSALAALDMGFKLKDRYPAGKLKIQAYGEAVSGLRDETA